MKWIKAIESDFNDMNKKERHEIYKEAVKRLIALDIKGMQYFFRCRSLYYVTSFEMKVDFPELYECKPIRNQEAGGYWWKIDTEEGATMRLMALEYAINKTK